MFRTEERGSLQQHGCMLRGCRKVGGEVGGCGQSASGFTIADAQRGSSKSGPSHGGGGPDRRKDILVRRCGPSRDALASQDCAVFSLAHHPPLSPPLRPRAPRTAPLLCAAWRRHQDPVTDCHPPNQEKHHGGSTTSCPCTNIIFVAVSNDRRCSNVSLVH